MADDSKQAPVDSPQVAALKFRRDTLLAKLKRLDAIPPTNDHDIDASRARTREALAAAEAELKGVK